jgi:hypothetical protein
MSRWLVIRLALLALFVLAFAGAVFELARGRRPVLLGG